MIAHHVRVHPSGDRLAKTAQLAWKLAALCANTATPDPDALDVARWRIADNAAVALAAINRAPVAAARAQALAHPRAGGAALFGLPSERRFDPEWAAWANGVAVRELDFHDTFLAAEYGHPGDNIPPLLAVAQHCGIGGARLLRAVVIAYEVHVNLMKSISLHRFRKDHVGHLAPAAVVGIGALLELPVETVFHAVNQAVHLSFATRQSRKGEISSWKACAPAFAGKLAIEAVDRAMRGEAAPSPIYEGEDGVIAWMLGGADAEYHVALPAPDEAPRAILETYTKAHSAEYQAQAIIDLAFEIRTQLDTARIREVVLHTSAHTHAVIGTGANDPQKMDPEASRETLDHSIMYILAVALEDGVWHHDASYARERARRASTVALWQRIRTVEDAQWSRSYLDPDPARRAFGGRLEVRLDDGSVVVAEKAVADAHPNGRHPWTWPDYAAKFTALAGPLIGERETTRFLGAVRHLGRNGVPDAAPRDGRTHGDEGQRADGSDPCVLNPVATPGSVQPSTPTGGGLFDWDAAAR